MASVDSFVFYRSFFDAVVQITKGNWTVVKAGDLELMLNLEKNQRIKQVKTIGYQTKKPLVMQVKNLM